jgi:hypothetical protein
MANKLALRGYDVNLGRQITGAAWDDVIGEAVFVVPEVAWQGLNELHRRGLGEGGDYRLPDVADMVPLDAVDAYERAFGTILAQLWVDGPERGHQIVDSIDEFLKSGGDLAGLEGVLVSAGLSADRDGAGADALQLTGQILKEFGVSEHLGGGRDVTAVLDAAGERVAGLGKQALEKAAESAVGDLGTLLRGEIDSVLAGEASGGSTAGHGDGGSSGGGPNIGKVILGALEAGIGALVAAELPVVGGALVADGTRRAVDGLSQGRPGSDIPAGTEHSPGVRAVETHYERTTVTKTLPDGTTETVTRESYHTKSIMTEARPKGGGENKCWDDAGGGFDPVTGEPLPVNPLTVVMCQPDEGYFDPTEIHGPRRRNDGSLGDFGPYAALQEIVTAQPGPDGTVDADALFADWTLTNTGAFEPPWEVTTEPFHPEELNSDDLIIVTGRTLTEQTESAGLETIVLERANSTRAVAIVTRADSVDAGATIRNAAAIGPEAPTIQIWVNGKGYVTMPL